MIADGETERARLAIVDLDEAIAPAIAAARTLSGERIDASVAPARQVDPALVEEAREALRDLLFRRSLSARAGFRRYADALGLDPAGRAAHPLNQALEQLDYDTALALIDANAPAAGAQ